MNVPNATKGAIAALFADWLGKHEKLMQSIIRRIAEKSAPVLAEELAASLEAAFSDDSREAAWQLLLEAGAKSLALASGKDAVPQHERLKLIYGHLERAFAAIEKRPVVPWEEVNPEDESDIPF